jgi:hypothetical protein
VELLGERQAEAVIADKGYDNDSILAHIEGMNAEAVIPPDDAVKSSVSTTSSSTDNPTASNAASTD